MPITIRELAKIAKVSPSTVSRALRDSPQISEETKERIRLLAEKFNCVPNRLAKGFFDGKSTVIGVIVPDVSYPFYSKIIFGIEQVASEREYSVMVCNSLNKPTLEKKHLFRLVENRVAGIIIAATQDQYTAEYVWELQREKIPLVAIDRRIRGIGADFVGTDDVSGAYKAVKYLIDLGHTRIGYISGPEDFSTSIERFEGYRNALNDSGLVFDKELVVKGASFDSDHEIEQQLEGGRDAVRELMSIANPPTAVFAVNDYVALGVVQGLTEKGFRVPHDVSVVGYADMDIAALGRTPLTTIRQPSDQVGMAAAGIILDRLTSEAEDSDEFRSIILDVDLVIRQSTSANHSGSNNG